MSGTNKMHTTAAYQNMLLLLLLQVQGKQNHHACKHVCGTKNASQPGLSTRDEILSINDNNTVRECARLLVLLTVHLRLDG